MRQELHEERKRQSQAQNQEYLEQFLYSGGFTFAFLIFPRFTSFAGCSIRTA